MPDAQQSRPCVVSLQVATPRTIAAVHARLPSAAIPASFREYLDQVYSAAREGVVELDGQNVFLYHATSERGIVDAAFGVGIRAPFTATGVVVPTPLPVGETATTTHVGSYGTLRNAHTAIAEWCRANGRRQAGVSWEIYGHWTDDEAQLRTDVFYLLEPAAST